MLEYLKNPHGLSNTALYADAKKLGFTFLHNNSVLRPELKEVKFIGNDILGCADIHEGLRIDVQKCPRINNVNFPGAHEDSTPIGVLAHEIGHWIHYILNPVHDDIFYRKELLIREPGITTYGDTSTIEDFAESMRIYITNPNLLYVGRNMRFRYFRDHLRLKPIIRGDWRSTINHAHTRAVFSALRWIKKNPNHKEVNVQI